QRVEAANRVRAAAAKAGRTYEEQLEIEQKNGTLQVRRIGDVTSSLNQQNGAAGQQQSGRQQAGQQQANQRAPQQGAAQQAAPEEDDDAFIFAGLVGTGGGGLTPLVLAAREGDFESAKLLLAAGADINQTTEYGWTPLLTATNNRHYQLGKYLIEHGAD